MQQVYLNGEFMPAHQAKISPMDRGFLFGDAIYEVIPCYQNKPVGLNLHLARIKNGLSELQIKYEIEPAKWQSIIEKLLSHSLSRANSVYIQVSRGADTKRFHAYPKDIEPTVFAYAFEITDEQPCDIHQANSFTVKTAQDLRWQRCNIKSTSLLGNVMHFQQGREAGVDEVILYNKNNEITEAATCNVFVIKNQEIATPPLDNQLLPGVTRRIVIDALLAAGGFNVKERIIRKEELFVADEIWLTSSSKELGPVIEVDGIKVGTGLPGPVWLAAKKAYNAYKFSA